LARTPSLPTAHRSIRLPNALADRIEAVARRAGHSANAAFVAAVQFGIAEIEDYFDSSFADSEPRLSIHNDADARLTMHDGAKLQFRVFARDADEEEMLRNLLQYVEAWRAWRAAQKGNVA
jgi:hypothetical protein